MTKFVYAIRCRTCNITLRKIGDGEDLGLPSASRRGGYEFDPTFGANYEGLAAANLMNKAMEDYLQTLKKHRNHRLERRFKDHPEEDPDVVGPWKEGSEPQPSPDFLKGYAMGRFAAACERCGKSFVAKSEEKLRRFTSTPLSAARIRTFFDNDSVDNSAAPLAGDRYKLALFLSAHEAHGVRVALLTNAAERAAFLPRRKSKARKVVAPAAVRDLADWLARLEQSGWLDDVGEVEAARIREAASGYAEDPARAFHALSAAGFDAECIESSGDYEQWIISSYRVASGGAFTPTKVRDRLSRKKGTAVISFEAGGRKFSREFPQEDDYVADGVHDFLNHVLAELGEERRFELLPSADQTGQVVCVRPATYQRALETGLIPDRVTA